MLDMNTVVDRVSGLGLEQIEHLRGCTYKDCSTVIVCPTRGMIHHRVVESWNDLIRVPNQRRSFLFCSGDEVGVAYNRMIERVLGDASLSKYRYLMTVEDDNLLPADAHLRLLEAIQSGPWDAVSGLYFQKQKGGAPLALGGPDLFNKFGVDFTIRDVREAISENKTIEVNGIPMGCAIYKMDLFREIAEPWFTTVNNYFMVNGRPMGRSSATQDLAFCERARLMGKRFAVDCGLHVGHLDVETGEVY